MCFTIIRASAASLVGLPESEECSVDGRAQRLVSLTEGRETTQSSKSPFLFYKNKRSSLVDLCVRAVLLLDRIGGAAQRLLWLTRGRETAQSSLVALIEVRESIHSSWAN